MRMGFEDTIGTAGTATAPANGAAIPTIPASALVPGMYEVRVKASYGGTADVGERHGAPQGTAKISSLHVPSMANGLAVESGSRVVNLDVYAHDHVSCGPRHARIGLVSTASHLRHLTAAALEWVFPARCAACDALGESPFCAVCAETLVPAPAGCPLCGAPQDETLLPALKPRRCPNCRVHPPRFSFASAPFLHGGALAEAIYRLKYERREDLGSALGVLFEGCPVPKSDLLVPIPLHPKRLRQRGYDQARLLADGAARRFGIPVEPFLRRVRETGQQVGRDRTARERSVRGAFASRGGLTGLHLCLIDDVLTTGATASAAAAALLEAGAARVEVRTLARAP